MQSIHCMNPLEVSALNKHQQGLTCFFIVNFIGTVLRDVASHSNKCIHASK